MERVDMAERVVKLVREVGSFGALVYILVFSLPGLTGAITDLRITVATQCHEGP